MRTQAQRRRTRGQGNTEYIIIVALIAIATIGVITVFGDNLRNLFGESSDALAGDDDIDNRGQHTPQSVTEKNMKNFAGQAKAYNPGGMRMMKSSSASGLSAGGAKQ